MSEKQATKKNICMITAGSLIVTCWILFIYNVTKDNPNDYSAAIFAVFYNGTYHEYIFIISWSFNRSLF